MFKLKKHSTRYSLSKEDVRMMIEIDENDKITIINLRDNRYQSVGELKQFVFEKSNPRVVRIVGELLIQASKIRDNENALKRFKESSDNINLDIKD